MDDLVVFLRVQLDEDERVAQAATSQGIRDLVKANMDRLRIVRHVAHWEPDRVLAEVAAKRRVVDDCEDSVKHSGITWPMGRRVLRLLAQPYTGRKGWREEWRA